MKMRSYREETAGGMDETQQSCHRALCLKFTSVWNTSCDETCLMHGTVKKLCVSGDAKLRCCSFTVSLPYMPLPDSCTDCLKVLHSNKQQGKCYMSFTWIALYQVQMISQILMEGCKMRWLWALLLLNNKSWIQIMASLSVWSLYVLSTAVEVGWWGGEVPKREVGSFEEPTSRPETTGDKHQPQWSW